MEENKKKNNSLNYDHKVVKKNKFSIKQKYKNINTYYR